MSPVDTIAFDSSEREGAVIQHRTLASAIFAELREDVLSCRIEPGEKLNVSSHAAAAVEKDYSSPGSTAGQMNASPPADRQIPKGSDAGRNFHAVGKNVGRRLLEDCPLLLSEPEAAFEVAERSGTYRRRGWPWRSFR